MPGLPEIPFIDIRDGSPVDLLMRHADAAKALARATTETFGLASRIGAHAAFPYMDRASRAWLERTGNPYKEEIRAFGDILGIKGVTTLNIVFEWGCTSSVFRTENGIQFRRVLDWKFPKLGEHLIVAHQRGIAGDFYNITWPGMAGIYHAVAPGRFAAAINQAPMRRFGRNKLLDWARGRIDVKRDGGMPAAHLLRQVFETAPDYATAKKMLCESRIAVPAIFILAGPDDGCVVERIEGDFAVREIEGDRVCASNHFETALNATAHSWEPRSGDSPERLRCARSLALSDVADGFSWFKDPIANPTSRVVLNAEPASGAFAVMGVNGPEPVTAVFARAAL